MVLNRNERPNRPLQNLRITEVFMDMTRDKPIFSTNSLLGRRLRVQRTLLANVRDSDAQLHHARQDVLHQIANVIAKEENFVKFTPSDETFVQLSVDCIVLTTDEYEVLCRMKFREGMEYARMSACTEPDAVIDAAMAKEASDAC